MNKDVIIACDFEDGRRCLDFLEEFPEEKPYLKIGMELFYSEGPAFIKEMKAKGFSIFLDLKLHDIPNTVEQAMKRLAQLGVDMVNVHAQGGLKMMERAKRGLDHVESPPLLIAVTQLTSTSQEMFHDELQMEGNIEDSVSHLAQLAKKAGLHGVVCSPWEAKKVHELCGNDFLTVTPGIRFASDSKNDQKRVTTPKQARECTSDFIVVGRSITKAENPWEAYQKAKYEFLGE